MDIVLVTMVGSTKTVTSTLTHVIQSAMVAPDQTLVTVSRVLITLQKTSSDIANVTSSGEAQIVPYTRRLAILFALAALDRTLVTVLSVSNTQAKSTTSVSVTPTGVQMTVVTIWESAVQNARRIDVTDQRVAIATTVQRTRILTSIITVFVMNTILEKIAPHIQESVILFAIHVVDQTPVTASLVWKTLTWITVNAPVARTGTALLVKYG